MSDSDDELKRLEDYQDSIASRIPDAWDDDVGQEAVIDRWLDTVEARLKKVDPVGHAWLFGEGLTPEEMTDDELLVAVAELDSRLMRPIWVARSARSIQASHERVPHPSSLVKGARTRELNAARQVDAVVREYVKEHPDES